jgi:hypothetical protein
MDYPRPERSPAALDALVMAAVDHARPFPRRRAAEPRLEQATRDLLAATARAWGLAGRLPATRQVR